MRRALMLLLRPFLRVGNAFVKRILRSPLHWLLSGQVVMLEITGRKTGKRYLVPVNYRDFDGGVTVLTYRGRKWWRNLRGVESVPIYLRGRRVQARVEMVLDDLPAIAHALTERGWVRKAVADAQAQETVLIRLWVEEGQRVP